MRAVRDPLLRGPELPPDLLDRGHAACRISLTIKRLSPAERRPRSYGFVTARKWCDRRRRSSVMLGELLDGRSGPNLAAVGLHRLGLARGCDPLSAGG
jgi:hypothetical protein